MGEFKYYSVTTKCGHVGRENYIPITYAVKANSAKEASNIARHYPRVKHNHKDAILSCFEIDENEYLSILETNNKDPYLKCKSKREQKQTCDLVNRLVLDPNFVNFVNKRDENKLQTIHFKQRKLKEKNKFNWYEELIEDQLIYA